MLSVTDLTSYLYCARKLYYRKILGIKEKAKAVSIKGTIKHRVFELAGKEDPVIISAFTAKDSLEDLEMKYRSVYYKVLMFVIKQEEKKLKNLGLTTLEVYQEIWPFFLEEAKAKSKELFKFAKEKKVYGDALWLSLPKGVPELKIFSNELNLVGVVDKVDVDRGFIPIELKTGKAPREGVWKNHKIQVGAYMLLLSEHYGQEVKKGYVDYLSIGEQRKVVMNPFLKDEILEIRDSVNALLVGELPARVEEKWKCDSCGIREECYRK